MSRASGYPPPIYVAIRGKVEHETEKAYYLNYIDALSRNIKVWIPKSQTSSVQVLTDGSGECILHVAEWVLKKAGCEKSNITSPNSEE